jgi:hypothetical protein
MATVAQLDGFIDLLVDAVLREMDDPTKKNGPQVPDENPSRGAPGAPSLRGMPREVCSDPRSEAVP